MDLQTTYHRTVELWADHVNKVAEDQWDSPTPCREWTVRDLVAHVTGEDLWTVPLMEGRTIEQVGDRLSGELLGEDAIGAALAAASEAATAVAQLLPEHPVVHLSYGEEQAGEYVHQLTADHLVHAWDLAVATGSRPHLDPHLVGAVASWFARHEQDYRAVGAIGPRGHTAGDPQGELLAAFGRDPAWGVEHACLARFAQAFGRGDVAAVMALMTDDCVFEATGPAPDGTRHEGADAVRKAWEELFGSTRRPRFTEEDSFVAGDRAVLRWRFDWLEDDGAAAHVRGVDLLRMRGGLVAEKLSYVKG